VNIKILPCQIIGLAAAGSAGPIPTALTVSTLANKWCAVMAAGQTSLSCMLFSACMMQTGHMQVHCHIFHVQRVPLSRRLKQIALNIHNTVVQDLVCLAFFDVQIVPTVCTFRAVLVYEHITDI